MSIKEYLSDTIAAIATPPGNGAIAIIRISGEKSFDYVSRLWRGVDLCSLASYSLVHGYLYDPETNTDIDEVLLLIYKSPKSFTGEDMIEISCHGGQIIPAYIMQLLIQLGVRPADPGEFSRRAFLNGKIDLIQAEAIDSIVKSQNLLSSETALSLIEKKFSKLLQSHKRKLIDVLSHIEVQVDYPEEDFSDYEDFTSQYLSIQQINRSLIQIIEDSQKNIKLERGAMVLLVGKTNVGKSSLFNLFAGEPRALVSEVHGTTRDYLELKVQIGNLPITLIDTAGFRLNGDYVEALGQEKTKELLSKADLILLVLDGSIDLTQEDQDIFNQLTPYKKMILINKSDLIGSREDAIREWFGNTDSLLFTSAKTSEGFNELEAAIQRELLGEDFSFSDQKIFCQARHLSGLRKCKESLDRALQTLDSDESPEFTALEIRIALSSIAEIVGEVYTEDILDNIFNKFCIGK